LTVADHLLAGLLALICAAQLLLRVDPAASSRALLYRAGLISGLVFAVLPLAVWSLSGRPLDRFGLLGWLGDVPLILGFGCFWLLPLGSAYRAAAAGRFGEPLMRVYRRLGYLMPRTRRELRTSWLVSAVAATGEEIAFRGFLLWYGAVLVGPLAALVGSALLFAAAHNYQGRLGMAVAASAGLLLGLLYLASGSLVLAIWLHATYNMASFTLGRQLLAASGEARAASL
jgi:uncharacterized protein